MRLETFNWNNGTLSSPIVLDFDQIEKLIAIGRDERITSNVQGYVTTTTGNISKYLNWSLCDRDHGVFPNLNCVANEIPDTFDVYLQNHVTTVNEGNTVPIVCEGIPFEYMNIQIINRDTRITSGETASFSPTVINNRIRITENGALQCDIPQENADWVSNIRLRACPIYEDFETTYNKVEFDVRIQGIAITDANITADATATVNSNIILDVESVPANATKLSNVEYGIISVTGTTETLQINGNVITAPSSPCNLTINVGGYLFGSSIPFVTKSIEVTVTNTLSKFQIKFNQIYDGSDAASASKIVQGAVFPQLSNAEGFRPTSQENLLMWIRENSHRYLGKYFDAGVGTGVSYMELAQLDDNDTSKYAFDGSDAPIGEVNSAYNVFMRMPTFYYRLHQSPANENIWVLTIALDETMMNDDIEGTWHKWDTNKLIGAYESYMTASNSEIRSISGVTSPHSPSWQQTTAAARAMFPRNERNFTTTHLGRTVDYETHVVMALLYYAWYGHTNCQYMCGFGTDNHTKPTGLCDDLGMTDTVGKGYAKDKGLIPTLNAADFLAYPGIGDGTTTSAECWRSINFWGLENWWGNRAEWVDDIVKNNSNENLTLYERNLSDIKRLISIVGLPLNSECYPTRWKFGDDIDLIAANNLGSNDKGYCDSNYFNGDGAALFVANRGSNDAHASGGVGTLRFNNAASYAPTPIGSRLVFDPGTIADDGNGGDIIHIVNKF